MGILRLAICSKTTNRRCDWSENDVTPLGSAYFLISEVVAHGVVMRNLK